jgi:Domain of unknown function (DUF1844)
MERGQDTHAEPLADPSLFQLLALSLGNAALVGLGLVNDPTFAAASGTIDLAMAKQNIDLLEMLDAKTNGNLTADERQLLHGLLFDLRLKFVEASRRA